MWLGRRLTDDEKAKIKENKAKEYDYRNYKYEAVQRMKPKPCGKKMKDYTKGC